MVLDALLAWLHFAFIFALVSVLTVELVSLRYLDPLANGAPSTITRLTRIDLAYLIIAILVLLSGLARAFFGIKGWGFYASSWMFHLKFTLFVVIGLISLVPTRNFMRWRKAQKINPAYAPPPGEVARVRMLVHLQLTLLLLMPLVAALMARGYGQITP